MSRQYGRHPPRNLDVKSRTRTMNKFVALDPDVASNYEDLDDQESGSSYRYRGVYFNRYDKMIPINFKGWISATAVGTKRRWPRLSTIPEKDDEPH